MATPRDEYLARGPQGQADFVLELIRLAVFKGLEPIYHGDAKTFIADLWCGHLPWTNEEREPICKLVEADDRFPLLREAFKIHYGEDVWADEADRLKTDW